MAPAGRALALATAVAVAAAGGGPSFAPQPAQAQGRGGPPIIRDTEIENLLRDYAAPILKTAGLAKQNVRIVILNDRAFNAFVMDGRHIFINTGALVRRTHAERSDRRVRARDRPLGRRPS